MVSFPVYLPVGPLRLHPHPVFEAIAYMAGLYINLFRRTADKQAVDKRKVLAIAHQPETVISNSDRWSVSVGALAGALIGAKLLVLVQHVNLLQQDWRLFLLLALQGKTIVGALIGGVVGVELTKKIIGLRRSTGDGFVFSVIVGMMIGHGVARHPTQLYEIGFLFILLILLWRLNQKATLKKHLKNQLMLQEGDLFKLFMIAS